METNCQSTSSIVPFHSDNTAGQWRPPLQLGTVFHWSISISIISISGSGASSWGWLLPTSTGRAEVVGRPEDCPGAPYLCPSKAPPSLPRSLSLHTAIWFDKVNSGWPVWPLHMKSIMRGNHLEMIGEDLLSKIRLNKNKKKQHQTHSDFKFMIVCINSLWQSTRSGASSHYITLDDRPRKSVHMVTRFVCFSFHPL